MDHRSSITPRDLECMLSDETTEPRALPLSLLENITDGFSDKQRIGSGGFAVVYKGKLENITVAVKRMSNTYKYEKEFQREVECLMMVQHKNIVKFLGYCADTQGAMARHEGKFVMADVQQRLLCFEYLPKGSLHEHITDISSGLQWRDRYHVIKGVCEGLHYLHQKNIVHLDLKPANILLGDNFMAKITDFGLSRCFDDMQSRVKTLNIGGTLGYLAPEFSNGEITYQFDIYSLGVIIIEILTGKKGYHAIEKVVESWSNMLEESQSNIQLEQVRVCAEIGIECTNFDPAKRPDIQHIINRLDETETIDGYIVTSVITSQQFTVRKGRGHDIKQLRDLNNLCGSLEIDGLENVKSKEEALGANLAAKERLTELTLRWGFSNDIGQSSPEVQAEVLESLCPPIWLRRLCIRYYRGSRCPYWMQSGGPKDLQKLEISHFSPLGGPPPQLVEVFPHLRVLRLFDCSWDALPSNMEQLRWLKKLVIHGCHNIRSLPALPQFLEKIEIGSRDDEFMKSCQTAGHPNCKKLEHIPRVIFCESSIW